MPLVLRWQAKELALLGRRDQDVSDAAGESIAADASLGSIKLDFDLSPLTLTSDEERARLVAALTELRGKSVAWETPIDLRIPAIWGITLHLPDPHLPPDELARHARWELSKAILDPVDQYCFHYAPVPDGSIRLGALRVRILDLIQQVAGEADFELRGIFFDEEDFAQVNLLEASAKPEAAHDVQPAARLPEEPGEEPAAPRRKTAAARPSWLLAVVLLAGLIVVSLFAWKKMTTERAPRPQSRGAVAERKAAPAQPGQAMPESLHTAKTPTDTTAQEGLPQSAAQVSSQLEPGTKAATSTYTPISRRLDLLKKFYGAASGSPACDLISFTGDRFLIQPAAANSAELNAAGDLVKSVKGLSDVKIRQDAVGRGPFQASISGGFTADAVAVLSSPDSSRVVGLASKHGLRHPRFGGLIFTGRRDVVLAFLSDLSAFNYSIYRLIFVPWGANEYRVVLEF